MRKFTNWLVSLLMLLTIISPTAVSAQTTAVTTDEMSLNIINALKTMQSFRGDYSGNFDITDSEGTYQGDFSGNIQLIITPALEFGFDLNLGLTSEAENPQLDMMSYLIDGTIYTLQDDSTVETDGEWVMTSASEAIGSDPAQFSMIYQLLVSMFEGMYRGVYLPSTVNELLTEKTTIEETASGYTITMVSFETQDEWIAFFEALEELEQEASSEVEDQTGGLELETSLDEYQEMAEALSDNISYTLTMEVNEEFYVTALNFAIQTISDSETGEAGSIDNLDLEFTMNLDEFNSVNQIEIPAELEGLIN